MIALRPFVLLGLLVLSGCADGGSSGGTYSSGQSLANAQTRAACRQRAEEVDMQQNRAQIYSPPPAVNTPYSANYLSDQPDRGLSDLYAHDKLVADCIRNTGTGADRTLQPAPQNPPSQASSQQR
jgi:hypothetical protein